MEWVETTGKTVAEAKDAALDQLGVDDADAEFVVVNEPRAGLFGRMRGEARVRARVRPTSPRPKRGRSRRPAQEQRRDSGSRGGGGGNGRGGARGTAVADAPPTDVNGNESEGTPSRNGAGGSATGNRNRRRGSRGGAGRTASGGGQRTSGSSNSNRGTDRERPQSGVDRSGRSGAIKEEATVGEALSLEEQGETAREFIDGLIDEMGLNATVTLRVVDEETVEVVVDGQELGVLVGRGGATLGALQELARTVVQSRTVGPTERILVDVAGYRAKRAEALTRFTTQVAEEVVASGSEQALEPMLAPDRKVVHDTVGEIDGVETRSEGEEPRRYVVVSPVGSPSVADED